MRLATDFGVFVTPNISPDPKAGIGNWSFADFANALQRGIDPRGPPPLSGLSLHVLRAHEAVGRRRSLRLPEDAAAGRDRPAAEQAGVPLQRSPRRRPLEARLHASRRRSSISRRARTRPSCAAATWWKVPATAANAIRRAIRRAGPTTANGCRARPTRTARASSRTSPRARAASPAGRRRTSPTSSSPASRPDYDSVGGSMVAVQEDMASCPPSDRAAIAAYLKAIPAASRTAARRERQ